MNISTSFQSGRLTVYLTGELDHHEARKTLRAHDDAVDDELERLESKGFDPAHREADAALDEALNILADLVRLNAGRPMPKQESTQDESGLFDGLD